MKYLIIFFLLAFASLHAQIYNCQDDLFPSRNKENKLYGYVNLFGEWQVRSFYDIAKPFKEGLSVVGKHSKFGVISCEGKVVLKIEYQQIKDFVNGFAWVQQSNKWGLINSEGTLILPCQYEQVADVSRFGDYAWVQQSNKWGVFDKEKVEFVHAIQFDTYQQLSSRTSLVSKNNQKGLIAHGTKKPLLEPDYDSIQKFAPYLLAIKKNQRYGVVTDDGEKIVPVQYEEVTYLGEGLFAADLTNKYAIFKNNGRRVVPHVLDEVNNYQSGKCLVKSDGKALFLDRYGKRLFGQSYEDAFSFQKNGQAIVKEKNRFFLIDTKGRQIGSTYLNLKDLDQYYAAESENGWQVMMKDTMHQSPPIFTEVIGGPVQQITVITSEGYRFYNLYANQFGSDLSLDAKPIWDTTRTYASVMKANRFGIIHGSLSVIVPIQYSQVGQIALKEDTYFLAGEIPNLELFNSDAQLLKTGVISIQQGVGKHVIVETQEGFEIITKTGKQVVLPHALLDWKTGSDVYLFSNDKGKYGLLSQKGHEVLNAKYSDGKNLGNNRWVFESKKSQQVVNQKGQLMFETSNKNFVRFEPCGVYVIQDQQKLGLLSKKGEGITAVQYDDISSFYGVYAVVKMGDFYGIIGKSGKLVRELVYRSKKVENNFIILSSNNQSVKLFFSGVVE